MHLDMRSILFVQSIVNTVVLFLAIFVWIGIHRRFPGTFGWIAAIVLTVIGKVLVMFVGLIPDFFSIVIGNTCMIAGFMSFYFGLMHFIENRVKGYFNIVLIFIFLGLFLYFGIVSPSLYLRNIIFSVFAIVISSQCVFLLIKNARGIVKLSFIGLSVMFSFYALVYIVRIIATIVWPPGNNYIQSIIVENVRTILGQVIILVIGIFMVVIINQKLQSELKIYANKNKLLVREIHHRVKNNLQMILSLLHLQSARTDESYLKESFNIIRNRILSVSIVHEKLYKQKDLRNIGLSYYVTSIIEGLISSYELDSSSIRFHSNVPDCKLDIAIAVPVGLILNELITNSIKHAFPGDYFGTIHVEFHKNTKQHFNKNYNRASTDVEEHLYKNYNRASTNVEECTLSVKDDGVGLPEDFVLEGNNTLGAQLLITLVEQLNGSIDYKVANGTLVTIVFPV